MEPKKIVKIAKERGLECIAITDHDSIAGAIEAKKYEDDEIKVLLGEEILTDCGDLIGIDIKEEILEKDFFKAVKEIKEQGGFTILPHPYKGHKNVEEIAKHVDLIEVYNARVSPELNEKAYNLAKKLGKKYIAGSDAHLYREIGLTATQANEQNSYEILQSFKNSDFNTFLSQIIKSFKHKKITLFIRSIKSIAIFLFRNSFKFGLHFSLRIIRKIYFSLLFNNFTKKVKNPDVLFSSFLISWRKYTHQNASSYEYDLMVGDVIERAKEKIDNISCIDIDSNHLLRSYNETRNKFNKSNDWVCLEQFITFKNIFLALHLVIKKSFGYQIDKKYELYLQTSNSNLFQDIFDMITADYIINKVKPECVFLTCEYCGIHKQFVYIGNLRSVPVLVLQHGIITPTHYSYIFDKEEKGKIILPDKTCVFGQYHYDLLTKNSIYEPEQVVVTGQPRYDVLYHAGKIYNKEKFLENYNINPNHKIILWTTQCHGLSEEENIKNFKAVFETMRNLKDVILIIKQHPGEGGKYRKMIEDHLNKYNLGINAVITPKSSDTYEQLFVCDLMITKNSTTAMEAVALNRPVIVLNLIGAPDVVDYVEQGVALGVYNEKDLKPAIEKLLKDDSVLAKNRERYVGKYLYKIDGKATDRVVKLIEEMITVERKRDEK